RTRHWPASAYSQPCSTGTASPSRTPRWSRPFAPHWTEAMVVRDLRPVDAAACDDIVRGLPHFFWSPTGLAMCAEAGRTQRGWVADVTGTVNGFLLVDYPLPSAPEISWMAVRAGRRRQGVGRTLLEHAVRALAGAHVLSVLTLAPSVRESGTDTYAGT